MFLGEFEHTIDDKGRLTIPAKFREELADGIVVTRGFDKCLWAYTRSEWERLSQQIAKMPSAHRPSRNLARFLFSSAFDSTLDKQGRVLITQTLRNYAEIDADTIIIGVMNRIEIWAPQRWSEIISEVEESPEAMIEQLDSLDF